MTNKTYDLNGAESLIPILRVIQREIGERRRAIQTLSAQIKTMDSRTDRTERELRTEAAALIASVSTHRREIRLAKKELNKLGCTFDVADPRTVHIPGEDGSHDGGYTWRVGQAAIQEMHAD